METVATTFDETLAAAVAARRYVRLEYLTDAHEFIKTDVALRQRYSENGQDVVELATGDVVPVARIVSIAGQLSPNFPGYISYSCDC